MIDGGPLGFLTWTIPLLVGSLAYDVVARGGARRGAPAPGLVGRADGSGLRPIVPDGIARRAAVRAAGRADQPLDDEPAHGSVSYLTFSTGLLAGGLRPVRRGLRPRRPPGRPLPHVRPQRPGGLHPPRPGRRRRQAVTSPTTRRAGTWRRRSSSISGSTTCSSGTLRRTGSSSSFEAKRPQRHKWRENTACIGPVFVVEVVWISATHQETYCDGGSRCADPPYEFREPFQENRKPLSPRDT